MRIGPIVALAGLVISQSVWAQSTQPAGSGLLIRPLGGGSSAALQPVTYAPDTGEVLAAPTTQPMQAFREGTTLSRRAGRLARSADGKSWEFTPDLLLPGNLPSPALTLLPNLQLLGMVAAVKNPSSGDSRFYVSGVVTEYNYHTYLLAEVVAPVEPGTVALVAEKVEPTPPTTRQSKPLPPDQMLSQMLKPTAGTAVRPLQPTTAPGTDLTSGTAAIAPGAHLLTVLREGTFLVDRTGRLTRSGDGQSWEFTFEADGRSMKDPPVVLLPNLKLMAMEQAVKGSNRDLRFRITGMVTEYMGRNYVLLEKVLVIPDVAQQF